MVTHHAYGGLRSRATVGKLCRIYGRALVVRSVAAVLRASLILGDSSDRSASQRRLSSELAEQIIAGNLDNPAEDGIVRAVRTRYRASVNMKIGGYHDG